jgi:hypothetical protein
MKKELLFEIMPIDYYGHKYTSGQFKFYTWYNGIGKPFLKTLDINLNELTIEEARIVYEYVEYSPININILNKKLADFRKKNKEFEF